MGVPQKFIAKTKATRLHITLGPLLEFLPLEPSWFPVTDNYYDTQTLISLVTGNTEASLPTSDTKCATGGFLNILHSKRSSLITKYGNKNAKICTFIVR